MQRRVVRVPRPLQRTFTVESRIPVRPLGTGSVQIVLGFVFAIAAGAILLTLPVANEQGEFTSFSDALFMAVSALTVTGLAVVDTHAHFSLFGEIVILVLIQVGGLGYMLGVTTALWVFGRRIGLRDQHLLRQYYGSPSISEAVSFAKRITYFALVAEAIGVVVLYVVYVVAGGPPGSGTWWAVFHSVSAFNNAGFSVASSDLAPLADDPGVLIAIALLVIAGSVGALPILVFFHREGRRKLPLDYILIYVTSAILLLLGTGFFLLFEWRNPETIGSVSPAFRPALAFFYAAMPRSGGFSTFNLDNLHDESQFATVALMFIGGAAGSTAGGIKVGTFALLFFALLATLRGEDRTIAFNRELPSLVVRQALAIALLGVAAVFLTTTALAALSDAPFLEVLFESVSALATVGLSTGVTTEFGDPERIVLMVAMIVGRFGPLMLVLEMNRQRPPRAHYTHPEHSVRLG